MAWREGTGGEEGGHPVSGTVETLAPSAQQGITPAEKRVLLAVLTAMRRVRHGYVQVVLHDGRVVQIDRLEKERL